MHELSGLLGAAAAAVAPEYFLLPIHGADPVYRERVYCYELYHQMRRLWPEDSHYRLNGEIDKRSHPYFADGAAPKPDFLVHEPGTGNNHAVFEVKSTIGSDKGTIKDFETLLHFRHQLGYERAIYLIYGAPPADALGKVQRCGLMEQLAAVELWVHPWAGMPAERVERVG